MNPYIGAIIQARLTSSRFPRKILEPIGGIPVLEHLVNRVHLVRLIDQVVIASPHSPECCLNEEIFIGNENDVLDRYYQASKKYNFDIIVRLTSDCPFIPPAEIAGCIESYLKLNKERGIEYLTNVGSSGRFGVPDGWDVEVFSAKMLEKAWLNTTDLKERENVTPYMKRNENSITIEAPKLSLDTKEDLERIKEWYELERQVYPNNWGNGFLRNEFYKVSTTESHAQSHKDIQS